MTHEEQQALFDTILRRANLPGSFNVENGIRLTSLSDGGAEGERDEDPRQPGDGRRGAQRFQFVIDEGDSCPRAEGLDVGDHGLRVRAVCQRHQRRRRFAARRGRHRQPSG